MVFNTLRARLCLAVGEAKPHADISKKRRATGECFKTWIPPAFSRVVFQFSPNTSSLMNVEDTTDFSRVVLQLRPLYYI